MGQWPIRKDPGYKKPVPACRRKSRPAQVAWLVVLALATAMSANSLSQPARLPLLLLGLDTRVAVVGPGSVAKEQPLCILSG